MFQLLFGLFQKEPTPIVVEIISDDTTALIAGLGGAILGAFISGLVAWILARQDNKNRETIRKQDRFNTQKAKALIVTVKIHSILNAIKDAQNTIEGMISEKSKQNRDMKLWEMVYPILGLPNAVEIDADSMSYLFTMKNSKLSNDVYLVASRWTSLLGAIKGYNDERYKLLDELSKVSKPFGEDQFRVDGAEAKIYESKSEALNSLIRDIRGHLKEDLENGQIIATNLGDAFRDYFDDPEFPVLTVTSQEAQPGMQETAQARDELKSATP